MNTTYEFLTQKILNKHYCIRDLRFHAIIKSTGLDRSDGILGLSPKNFGSHLLLVELKIAGLIDKTMVSFSNSFMENTQLFNETHD